jgi:phosphate transport system protein
MDKTTQPLRELKQMGSSRETFDRQLGAVSDEVLLLGSMVIFAIRQAMDSFQREDYVLARKTIVGDRWINEKRYSIESECVKLIATQQPMGRDVRFLASILEIITELERIGDYAKGISKITLSMPEDTDFLPIIDSLIHMMDLGLDMLQRSLDAFMVGDVTSARAIPLEDDRVDELYNTIANELTCIVIASPESIHGTNHLMWAAHNLERLADRVSNICERIVYVSTGELTELDGETAA